MTAADQLKKFGRIICDPLEIAPSFSIVNDQLVWERKSAFTEQRFDRWAENLASILAIDAEFQSLMAEMKIGGVGLCPNNSGVRAQKKAVEEISAFLSGELYRRKNELSRRNILYDGKRLQVELIKGYHQHEFDTAIHFQLEAWWKCEKSRYTSPAPIRRGSR